MSSNSLRKRRTNLGLTQEAVAARLGIDQGTVSAHELGTRKIGAEMLARYAKLYECRMDDLYTLEQPDDTTKEVKSA
jgi:transcriptional regulator with XRE-family HTH domain